MVKIDGGDEYEYQLHLEIPQNFHQVNPGEARV